jgi:hypothetical protein
MRQGRTIVRREAATGACSANVAMTLIPACGSCALLIPVVNLLGDGLVHERSEARVTSLRPREVGQPRSDAHQIDRGSGRR